VAATAAAAVAAGAVAATAAAAGAAAAAAKAAMAETETVRENERRIADAFREARLQEMVARRRAAAMAASLARMQER